MRLLTYERDGAARLGLLAGGRVIDAAEADAALPSDMLSFIEQGAAALDRARKVVDDRAALERATPVEGVRLLAPIPRPRRNIVCVGLNYA